MIDAILIPSSVAAETDDPKIRTYKVGQIARAASIHRIGEIVVYPDPQAREETFLTTVLAYAETPPYLRRILFSQRDELAFAGVLPPLNTPHHKAGGTPRIGDVRDGYATEHGVEIGANRPAKAAGDPGEGRVTVEIVGKESGRFVVTRRRGPPPAYWGFDVRRADSLTEALDAYDVTIATSRKGEETLEVKADGTVAVAFGSPRRGLEDLLAGEDRTRGAIPHWYNAVPDQGTDTIRTEEAVYLALEPVRKLLIAQGR